MNDYVYSIIVFVLVNLFWILKNVRAKKGYILSAGQLLTKQRTLIKKNLIAEGLSFKKIEGALEKTFYDMRG